MMRDTLRIGTHVSIAGSIDKAVDRAADIGCNTFQIFTRNPRSWKMKELNTDEVGKFKEKVTMHKIYPSFVHMPYLPNLASPKKDLYSRSIESLQIELARCNVLNVPYLITHLGSHLGSGERSGIGRVVDAINESLTEINNDVIILLENTSGYKNDVGGRLEDIGYVIGEVSDKKRIGFCLDTCHAFTAGYDIRTVHGVSYILEEIEEMIGLDKLRVIHLNDSKEDFNSKKDKHDHIGLGKIGLSGFEAILKNDKFSKVPFILETPIDERRDDLGNIRRVREIACR